LTGGKTGCYALIKALKGANKKEGGV